jgi:hypothetical protein
MAPLAFLQFRGGRGNMYYLSVAYYRGNLCNGDIELDGHYVGLVPRQLVPRGRFVAAGLHNMAKVPTI